MPSFYCIKFGLMTGSLVTGGIVALLVLCWNLNETLVKKEMRKMMPGTLSPLERKK